MDDIENIPLEMKQHDIFCCWKYEMKDDKKNKVPYSPKRGTSAKVNEPPTFIFHSFSDAKQAASQYNGIGLRVSHGICGLDVDDCIDEAVVLSDFATDVIRYFSNCYIEKSPSESGIHIYFKAPSFQYDTDTYYVSNQKSRLEVYGSGTTKRFYADR